MHTFVLALMLTAGPPPVNFELKSAPDIALLTSADAARLAGHWVRLRVDLESLPEARDGFVVFRCASRDHTLRTIWFESGEIGGDDADVRPAGESGRLELIGRLVVVQRTGRRDGAVFVPGLSELRLVDARLVK